MIQRLWLPVAAAVLLSAIALTSIVWFYTSLAWAERVAKTTTTSVHLRNVKTQATSSAMMTPLALREIVESDTQSESAESDISLVYDDMDDNRPDQCVVPFHAPPAFPDLDSIPMFTPLFRVVA